MITITEYRKLLNKEEQNLSDEEIESIRGAQYSLAQIIFEQWQKQRTLDN